MSGTLVMKFGGSTIGTPAALSQVLSIVVHEAQRWDKLVLVASALDGVTDSLLEAAHLAQLSNRRGYRRITATLRTRHIALVDQLPLTQTERNALLSDIDNLLFEMLAICQTVSDTPSDSLAPEISDAVVGVGERLSARIIATLLRHNNLRSVAIDATDIIVTDNRYGNAAPNIQLTQEQVNSNLLPILERNIVPVVTGFIGATEEEVTTTLGRGGSDYTASILSLCTRADELWVWADVDGMMTADPRELPDAQVIEELSYREVAELAYFGARILHAHMVKPLKERNTPLRIKNIFKPQHTGTLIHNLASSGVPTIKAVTSIQGIGLSADYSGSLSQIIQLVNEILTQTAGIQTDVMISSQSSERSFLCFVIPTTLSSDLIETVQEKLQERLKNIPGQSKWKVQATGIVTVIGNRFNESPSLTARILQSIGDNIALLGFAQGPSRCSISLVTHPQDTRSVMTRIHKLALKSDVKSGQLPTE